MTTKWRIHIILLKVNVDEMGDQGEADLLEEEELAGYREDFVDENLARQVFSAFSGITLTQQSTPRHASRLELEQALKAYREGTLTETISVKPPRARVRSFTGKDAERVQIILGQRNLQSSVGQILHVAGLMRMI